MDAHVFNTLKNALEDIAALKAAVENIHRAVDLNRPPDEIRALTLGAMDAQIKVVEGLRDVPGSRAEESLPCLYEARAAFVRKDDVALVYWNAKASVVALTTTEETIRTVLACEEAHPS